MPDLKQFIGPEGALLLILTLFFMLCALSGSIFLHLYKQIVRRLEVCETQHFDAEKEIKELIRKCGEQEGQLKAIDKYHSELMDRCLSIFDKLVKNGT